VTLTLPYPPSTNHAYAVRNGRKVKTTAARAYATEVAWAVADEERVDPDGWRPTPTDRLAVTIYVHAPDRRRRDLANTEKLALDAVCTALGIDDSQIDQLTLSRGTVTPANPHLLLTVRPM
jgi:crossover junction endodeoxyribonuclease RusA